MKASQQTPTSNINYRPQKGPIQSFVPGSYRNNNKSFLDKYSFEDNDLSRTSQLISQANQNDEEDWLRLEIKEITSIGKDLITFYLAVKYLVEYQGESLPNFDKKKNSQKQTENAKEIKQIKSKLVHGSILQSEHKNLVLGFKCKKQSAMPQNTKPVLTRLEFQIMRVFQAKNQPLLIAKQILNNPETNAEYEITFQQCSPAPGTKAKPIINMTFQIESAIQEQIDGSEDNLSDSKNDDVSEHLDGDQDAQKYENYTLGKSQNFKTAQMKKAKALANIFDNSNHEDPSQGNNGNDTSRFHDDTSSNLNQNNSQISNQKSSNAELIHKLNELSNMMDQNLEKSKNENLAYRNYLEETSNMIERFHSDSGSLGNINQNGGNGQMNPNFLKKNTGQKAGSPLLFGQVKQVKYNAKQANPQPQLSPQKNLSNPNKTTLNSNLNDTSSMGDRYNYVSRIQNTYINGQRFPYESRINNSSSLNIDGEKFNYLSKAQITDNNTAGEKNNNFSKGNDSNVLSERYNEESSKNDEIHIVGERYDYESRIENSNILDESSLNVSGISPVQPNSPLLAKKTILPKKQPFLKFNVKNQVSGTPRNQNQSRAFLFNLGDLDSSNIRYEYNDVSNIEETKNMQDLINQIEKIQKEWYQKRVLNRKIREDKKQLLQNQEHQNKQKPYDLASNPDDVVDLELKNFKIKFSEQTFYKKLIDGLKNKHQTYTKRNENNENGESQVPKNYLVFLVASQVDEENMLYEPENFSKIQINIPSQQIDKLLQLQSIEKQRSLSHSGSNGMSPTMSKIQEKEIIKAFEKQIYSKVMKIKLSKNDKNGQGEKKKARIIQIALEDESLTLSEFQIQGVTKDPQENRISLVGMYPLPVFDEQNKDGETSFYQNVSIEPLAIQMYDTLTGAQEGQLKFQLAKAKVDREIQTLEPLENIEEKVSEQGKNQKSHKASSSLMVGYETHQKKTLSVKSLKKPDQQSRLKQRLLEVDITEPAFKRNFINPNAQEKHANRQLKIQSQASNPISIQSEQPFFTNRLLGFGDNMKRTPSKRHAQPESRQSYQQSPVNDRVKSSKQENKKNEKELSSISQARPKSIHDFKLSGESIDVRSPRKEKDAESIGKIVKNHSSTMLLEVHPVVTDTEHNPNDKTVNKNFKTSKDSKQKLVPELQMSNIRKVSDPILGRKLDKISPIKFHNTSSRPQEAFPNSPSSIHENHDPQSDSSYFLMKQEFLATANLLESIKIKAQQFIEKVQSQRKIQTSDEHQSDKEGWKGFESQGESKIAYTTPIEKRMVNLGVNSFVVNETILSRKQISRNGESLTQPVTSTINLNPKAVSGMNSKRNSNNKSRGSKVETNIMEPRRNKFAISPEKQPQSLKCRNKNYEKDNQSNGSALSIYERKSKKREKPKKALVYKEESDYQFTQEEGKTQDDRRRQKPFASSSKMADLGEQSDTSNQVSQSGINDSELYKQYQNGTTQLKSSKRIKESAISSYSSEQVLEIKIFSLKIKLLSLPLVAKHLRNLSEDASKGKDFFVLVYTDYSQENSGIEENLSFTPPISQKCIRKKSAKQDEFFVLFNEKNGNSSPGKNSQGYLLVKGVEKTKLVVQLYQTSEALPAAGSQKSSGKDINSLEHISLITLSPKNKKLKSRPFASLTVTFIELLAQQESGGLTSRVQKSDLITYTNFLYEKQKILGKININYITEIQSENQRGSRHQGSGQKAKFSASRKEVIEEFKPLKNSYFRNYPDTKKHSQAQKEHHIKDLRSESGMTKKLSSKEKMRARISQPYSENQRNQNSMPIDGRSSVDPLEILKRKVPKALKSEEKSNKHSLSYAIRLNRSYHSPGSKGKGKELFDSLNSSSSAQFKGERLKEQRHKNSVYSSSHFEGGSFMQSPKKGQDNSENMMQLRQKKQEKKLKKLKEYQAASRIPMPYQQTEETRLSLNRRYEGGNIKFGKQSRFNSADSQELISRKGSKTQIPGPGHYEVKSAFDRHMIREP